MSGTDPDGHVLSCEPGWNGLVLQNFTTNFENKTKKFVCVVALAKVAVVVYAIIPKHRVRLISFFQREKH